MSGEKGEQRRIGLELPASSRGWRVGTAASGSAAAKREPAPLCWAAGQAGQLLGRSVRNSWGAESRNGVEARNSAQSSLRVGKAAQGYPNDTTVPRLASALLASSGSAGRPGKDG